MHEIRMPTQGSPLPSDDDNAMTMAVATLGEAMIGFVADGSAGLADIVDYRRFVVGAEVNVAVGLARLGHHVAFIGRVGNDGFGTTILRRLRAEGVNIFGLRVDGAAPTGILVRERRTLGPSEVIYYRRDSAGSRLTVNDVQASADTLREVRWFHVTGITPALSISARKALDLAIDVAREGGATISLDVNLRRKLWSTGEASSVLRKLARRVDVVIGDREELSVVTSRPFRPEHLLEAGAKTVVEKLGPAGSALHDAKGTITEPPLVVPLVKDPVGAGDAFCAGFIAARLEGRPVGSALRWANACGAAAVTVVGDMEGLVTRIELERLVGNTRPDSVR